MAWERNATAYVSDSRLESDKRGKMKVGDLVNANEHRGCSSSKHKNPFGLGVIVEVVEGSTLNHPSVGEIYLGDDYVVALTSGKQRAFASEELEVIA